MMNKNALLALAFVSIALLLAGCPGAPASGTCPPGTTQSGSRCLPGEWAGAQNWQGVALVSVLAVLFSMALFYMLAKGFEIPRLELWVRGEISQLAITIMFIAALGVFIFWVENGLLPEVVGTATGIGQNQPAGFACSVPAGTSQSILDFGRCYTDYISGRLSGFSTSMEARSGAVGKTGSYSYFCSSLAVAGFFISPCREVGDTQQSLGLGITALSTAAGAMQAQALLLNIASPMFLLLLPFGIILRSFSHTRRAAGAMIALAVGFFLVYPLMVVVNYEMVKGAAYMPGGNRCTDPAECGFGETCDAVSGNCVTELSLRRAPVFPPEPSHAETPPQGQRCFGVDAYYAGLVSTDFYVPLAFWVIIISLLLPLMNLLVTLTFIKWLAQLMGSEIEVAGLARLG